MNINVAGFVPISEVNGPGRRAVLWVQGCSMRCAGCWNPGLLSTQPQQWVEVDTLVSRIQALDVDGLTFSGGEPFDQAGPLSELAAALPHLTLMVFTGYTFDVLDKPDHRALLARADLVVAGPYRRDLAIEATLRSSDNQQLYFLTNRMTANDVAACSAASVEVRIGLNGDLTTTGFPSKSVLSDVSSKHF